MDPDTSFTPKTSQLGSEFFPPELFDTLPVAIYICDKLGYITSYNKAAAILWGRDFHALKQPGLSDVTLG